MRKARKRGADPTLKFTRVNLWFALGGLAAIVAGYYLLGQGSVTLAPVLLVLGYVVLLPLAIIA
ncbi:MAG: hypothetical protein F4187_04570 [Gemmatimonadetes bacterium]|nr:hypothetical protein [Gemmatimonadota bacterium]MYI07805.1 hypothetical protein [Gemmatimonadota bacterium]